MQVSLHIPECDNHRPTLVGVGFLCQGSYFKGSVGFWSICFQSVQEVATSAIGHVKSYLHLNGSVEVGSLVLDAGVFPHPFAPTFMVYCRLSPATLKQL